MLGWFSHIKIAQKLALGYGLVLVCLLLLGGLVIGQAQSMDVITGRIVSDAIPVNNAVRNILPDVIDEETGVRAFMITAKEPSLSAYATGQQGLAADLALLKAHYPQHPAIERLMEQEIKPELLPINAFYVKLIGLVRAGHIQAARAQINKAKALVHALRVSQAKVLAAAIAVIATAQHNTLAALTQLVMTVIGCALGAALLTILLAIILSHAIARPLGRLTSAAAQLAVGDTAVDGVLPLSSRDEIGVLSNAFRRMVAYQRAMTRVAERIAVGDLTQRVTVLADTDALGQAFATMSTNLCNLVGQVAESAQQVADGSQQLATAVDQMGQASTQISRAIEDVAHGTSTQSHSTAEALTQMTRLTGIVSQVATGTAQQQSAVGQADAAIAEMAAALSHTSQGVQAVTQAADRAASTATSGGAAVAQTIASIDNVRSAVLKSAEQVAVLGQRSTEVGAIVKAIDEIAEQTNLLALNAAIEAARAGEHGKGFAVVAAEVRKLAERAGSETREISSRIAAIQTQVADVVAAMQAGSSEVEQSVTLGQQARSALQEILSVVDDTRSQAAAISSAISQMTTSVEAVRRASGHVAQIAGATGEAASQMQQGTQRVNNAISEIAAVSEQSAAGAQEVSASTEEQTANVEEMAAGAQLLAQLAADLQAVVSRFILDDATVVQPECPASTTSTQNLPAPLPRVA